MSLAQEHTPLIVTDNATSPPARRNAALIAVLSLIMSLCLFANTFAVYAEGLYFTSHQYNFALFYPVMCIVLYGGIALCHSPSRAFMAYDWTNWRVYGPIGLLFSINYVFLLVASSYVANLFQIIFTQLPLVYTFFLNKYLLKSTFKSEQNVVLSIAILVNLLLIGNEVSFTNSVFWNLFWQLVFILGGVGAALGNILTEAYFKSIHHPSANPTTSEILHFELAKILVLNVVSNLYSLVGTFMFIYVVYPIEGIISLQDLASSNLWSEHSWTFYTFSTGSVLATIAQTVLFRYTSVTYTLVFANVAGALQVVLVSLPIGDLQQTSSPTQYMIYAILTVLSCMYAYFQVGVDSEEQHANQQSSRLVRYYAALHRLYRTCDSNAQINHDADNADTLADAHASVRFMTRFLIVFIAVVIALTLPLSFFVKQ